MKVVHLCLGSFFPDNYSYQENMLPKFHKEQGHDVEVIASLVTFDENGKITNLPEAKTYYNEYDIKVTRLNYKEPAKIYRKMKRFVGLKEALENTKPDILFIHGCQFLDIDIVVRYLQTHKNVKVYVDNHADFSNSARNFFSKNILHNIFWKHCAKLIEPYTIKFYGVLPARVDFLVNIYGLDKNKCELLVMGADDDLVKEAQNPEVATKIREELNLLPDDFVIMTGGKIDAAKTQTLLLMQAVKRITNKNVKLIVFGSVSPELTDKVKELSDGEKVNYIGWILAKDSYKYFAAADLVVFPGRHSVFWEQVAAQGIPMLVKSWAGTHHVDLGGNAKFLTQNSEEELFNEITYLLENPEEYEKMKKIATEQGMKTFSYNDIAKRAIK